jgi:fucokinase
MMAAASAWDYLVLTASNAAQAEAYETQLRLRRECGMLPQVREALVVADIGGKRIGSGGSTLLCLVRIVERERRRRGRTEGVAAILRELRILIVHAGGDSRRLPAYGPCGKIFVPLPAPGPAPVPAALFDRLVPGFLALPPGAPGRGQAVVVAGDALIRLDASQVDFSKTGLTALGCYAAPEEASRHGVFCFSPDGAVSLYLQKPSLAVQRAHGAIDGAGRTALDVAVMSLDAEAAECLLEAFGVTETAGALDFSEEARRRLLSDGIDLYREICCAMGRAASLDHYLRSVSSSGSKWEEDALTRIFPLVNRVPLHVELVPACRFLHFGSTRQLIESGLAMLAEEGQAAPVSTILVVNSSIAPPARVRGRDSWIEGCRIAADVQLAGENVLVGVDVDAPLALPEGACLEVLPGRDRAGGDVTFVRCYGVRDTFKHSVSENGLFCGRPLADWLRAAGMDADEVWPDVNDAAARSLWNARVFPAQPSAADSTRWLWMYAPDSATGPQLQTFREADRYSAAEIAFFADQPAFHSRRLEIWKRSSLGPCDTP